MFDNTAQAQMVAHVKEDGKRSTTRSSVELNGNIRNNKHAFQKFTPKRVRLARACFPGETLVFDRKGDPSQRFPGYITPLLGGCVHRHLPARGLLRVPVSRSDGHGLISIMRASHIRWRHPLQLQTTCVDKGAGRPSGDREESE